MTERRYFNIIGTGDIKDELTGKIIRGSKIGDLLNELYYENHRIKRRNNRYVKQNKGLMEENEELKRKVKHFKELWAETSMENTELREKIDKSNKRFVEKLNTIQKQWG